jgi:hypothetical protein
MGKFFKLVALLIIALISTSNIALAKKGKGGNQIMPVEFYGQASSATTGATDLVFTVTGLKSASECVVTPKSYGTGPVSFTKAVVTANTITLTVNANQTAGSTVINYICFKD